MHLPMQCMGEREVGFFPTSTTFPSGIPIPERFCKQKSQSPEHFPIVAWEGVPSGPTEVIFVMPPLGEKWVLVEICFYG